VIGEVILEQVESLVDGLGQAELTDQELDGTDAAAGDGPSLVGDVEMEVGCGEDRPWRGCGDGLVEPVADSPLAGGVVSVWNRLPLEISSWVRPWDPCRSIPMCRDTAGVISSFHEPITRSELWTTLG